MTELSRADILGMARPAPVAVDLSGDRRVYVRVMGGTERDRFDAALARAMENHESPNWRALLVCMSACDSHGERLFNDSDLPAIGNLACTWLDPVFAAAQRVNGLTKASVEELEKN